jgi:membrane associated rhomboid family serine protease
MDLGEAPPLTRQSPEPALRIPWPVGGLIAALLVAHLLRLWLGVGIGRFALDRIDLEAGHWAGLFTHIFIHASWVHLAMNCAFILAFGAPVARYLGLDGAGAARFFLFFLVCGVLSGTGFVLIASAMEHPGDPQWDVIGASGAGSGLMGAAIRLISGRGRLGPLASRTVAAMTAVWILANVVFGLTGLAPGAQGAPIAWQAHILGYLAGLLLIGLFVRRPARRGEAKTP